MRKAFLIAACERPCSRGPENLIPGFLVHGNVRFLNIKEGQIEVNQLLTLCWFCSPNKYLKETMCKQEGLIQPVVGWIYCLNWMVVGTCEIAGRSQCRRSGGQDISFRSPLPVTYFFQLGSPRTLNSAMLWSHQVLIYWFMSEHLGSSLLTIMPPADGQAFQTCAPLGTLHIYTTIQAIKFWDNMLYNSSWYMVHGRTLWPTAVANVLWLYALGVLWLCALGGGFLPFAPSALRILTWLPAMDDL